MVLGARVGSKERKHGSSISINSVQDHSIEKVTLWDTIPFDANSYWSVNRWQESCLDEQSSTPSLPHKIQEIQAFRTSYTTSCSFFVVFLAMAFTDSCITVAATKLHAWHVSFRYLIAIRISKYSNTKELTWCKRRYYTQLQTIILIIITVGA